MEVKFIIQAKEGATLELSNEEARSLQKLLGNLRNSIREELKLTDTESELFNQIHSILFRQYGRLDND